MEKGQPRAAKPSVADRGDGSPPRRPGERDRRELGRAGPSQGGRARRDGRTRGDDVVDDERCGRHPGPRLHRTGGTGQPSAAGATHPRRGGAPAGGGSGGGEGGGGGGGG